jgi:hypothetical protein
MRIVYFGESLGDEGDDGDEDGNTTFAYERYGLV